MRSGLTGTKAEIDKVVALYGASYEIIPTPESAMKYSVAHSTTLYGLDPAGRTRLLFPYDASVDEIVAGCGRFCHPALDGPPAGVFRSPDRSLVSLQEEPL